MGCIHENKGRKGSTTTVNIDSRKFMLIPPHEYRHITAGGEFICYTVIAFGELLKANFSRLNYVKLLVVTRCECSAPVYLQINAFRLVLV